MIHSNIDISVIVPMFNVEDYLSECVDSLLKQHDIDLEILLIDDGSTDRSGAIADQYAHQNSCIKVIHQENGGLSAARNTGLELAQGKYIAFVDSDDWIQEGSLKKLYTTVAEYQADVVMANLQYYHQDGSNKSPFNAVPEKLLHTFLSGKECFSKLIKSGAYTPMAWNYMYRREYIEQLQIRFEEGIIHEDELWTPPVLCQASRMVITDVDFYYYRQRDGSITNASNTTKRLNSLLCVANRLMEFADRFSFSGENEKLKNWLYVNIFRIYSNAFSILTRVKDSSYQLPEHQLARFWRDAWEMMPEPQKICRNYFRKAEIGLKKYTDWLTSDWVASIASQIGSGNRIMLIYNTMRCNDLSLILEDVPMDWIITTDRRYIFQADVVVSYLPDLSNELEEDLEKSEEQIWVAWHLESEKNTPLLFDTELRKTFDLWMCYQKEEVVNDQHLTRLCRKIYKKESNYIINSSKPFLSVVMPVYNGQLYIEQAIDSIIQQTMSDFELIIIDDASTDDTLTIINSYHDKRIKTYSNHTNRGNYPSRNFGMKNAVGKYIAVMDADDICLIDRFEKQSQFMETNKEIGIAGSAVRLSTGGEMFISSDTDFLKVLFFRENNISHPSLMFRKEMLEKYHLQYDEHYRYSADYDLLVRAFRYFYVTCMKEVLLVYRVHPRQISSEHHNSQWNFANQIRIHQLYHLNIQPTNEEIEIHLSLLQKKQTVKQYTAENYNVWSEKLILQNNILNYFHPSIFSDYICNLLNRINQTLTKH